MLSWPLVFGILCSRIGNHHMDWPQIIGIVIGLILGSPLLYVAYKSATDRNKKKMFMEMRESARKHKEQKEARKK